MKSKYYNIYIRLLVLSVVAIAVLLLLKNRVESEGEVFYHPGFRFFERSKKIVSPNGGGGSSKIHLRNEIIDTRLKPNVVQRSRTSYFGFNSRFLNSYHDEDASISYGKYQYLVHFKNRIAPSHRETLRGYLKESDPLLAQEKSDGSLYLYESRIISYIPDDGFLVVMSKSQAEYIHDKMDFVAWVGLYEPSHKLSMGLSRFIGNPIEARLNLPLLPDRYRLTEHERDSILSALVDKWYLNNEASDLHQFSSPRSPISLEMTGVGSPYSLKVRIQVRCKDSQAECQLEYYERLVTKYLSEQMECTWVERVETLVNNNKFAPTILLSKENGPYVPNDLTTMPLRGQGQIIGVADTGIDESHCFFYDPNYPFPINTTNFNHRKVVAYYTVADTEDDVGGHGTHVAGSIAGSPIDQTTPIAEYQGIAEQAKLAFYDIQFTSAENPTPPSNLNDMYQAIYDTGARIHSDSWGSVSAQGRNGMYSLPASEIDEFMYNHPDFLILRAAGNYGDYGFMSLLSQATAKNALVVGAEINTWPSFLDSVSYYDYTTYISDSLMQIPCGFLSDFCNLSDDDIYTKCCAEMSTYWGLSLCCPDSYRANQTDFYNNATNQANMNPNDIAYFSSRGPTADGRLKPDIIAPGYRVTSSRSNGASVVNQCGVDGGAADDTTLLALQGTSMATPLAAGSAAILRQYLMEGYFPTGAVNASNVFTPTAALLKALLINNAELLNGTYELTDTLTYPLDNQGPIPGSSFSQGWGALRLGNIASFGPQSTERWIGFAGMEEGQSLSEWQEPEIDFNQTQSFCITYTPTSGQPRVRAHLVWTDYPGQPYSYYALVNNLDLQLLIDDLVYLGNPLSGGYTQDSDGTLANLTHTDTLNNVEGIVYEPVAATTLKFTVTSMNIPIGPQKFNLVISGVNGSYAWAETCPQCFSGETQTCAFTNGVGYQKCESSMLWSKCLVYSCNDGYSYNSISGKCEKFLSYNYIIMIVAGATMALTVLIIGAIKYLEYREEKSGNLKTCGTVDSKNDIRIKAKPKGAPVTIPDLYSLLSPFMVRLIAATACSLVATASSILQPYYIGRIIQEIPSTDSIGELQTDFIIIFVLAFAEFVFSTISSWITGIVNERMIMKLQKKVFKAIIAQDLGFFSRNNAQVLMNVLIVDSPMLRSALTGILLSIASGICKLVGSLVFLLTISWKLSLAFFATIPILAIVTQVQATFTKRLTKTLLFYNSKASKQGTESMINMHVVTNYCRQDKEIRLYGSSLEEVFVTARRLIINNTLASSVKWLLVESLAFVILYFGTYLAINREFTVGLLISFSLYIGYVIDASNTIFGVYGSYVQALASAHRVFMILRAAPRKKTTLEEEKEFQDRMNEPKSFITSSSPKNSTNTTPILESQKLSEASLTDKEKKENDKKERKKAQEQFYKRTGISVAELSVLPSKYIELDEVRGDIEFVDVSFRYPTRPESVVLSNINIKLENGKCYGIVGPSGSGKSTLLELISRFYTLKEGNILIDGHEINSIRPGNLRSFVTCVHQNPYLFDSSVAENIGYAIDDPTMEQIIEAAKMANAHEFIEELPQKYQTVLGSAGNLLSGGQKKRIAVARAICARRKIMLLDEITSELDPESEEAITNSIKLLTKGHTLVMVAHKVAAVRDCDKIFVLDKGRVVEEGTHDELMKKNGRYFKLFSIKEDDDSLELPNQDPNNNNN